MGPLEEQTRGVKVCDQLCLGVVVTSHLPSDNSESSWWMELAGWGDMVTTELLRGTCLIPMRGVQRSLSRMGWFSSAFSTK